jgi:CRISPR-associated protein Cmr2
MPCGIWCLSRALDVWNTQIGSKQRTPMWEVYWICAKADQDGAALLDARKRWRWSHDSEALTGINGAICAMMGDWAEISGLQDVVNQRQQRQEFWEHVRQRLVDVRYRGFKRTPEDCLDLRKDEALCAPAMVKRLFPLLHFDKRSGERSALTEAIGWNPSVRASYAVFRHRVAGEGWLDKVKGILDRQRALSSTAEWSRDGGPHLEQDPVFWPSTSYLASTHWLAAALEKAPEAADSLAGAVADISPKYGLAEQNLWIKCLRDASVRGYGDGVDAAPLYVDGAAFFESSLMKFEGDRGAIDRAVTKLSALYGAVGSRPAPYYAVLKMDGDRIGDHMNSPHRDKLSRVLGDFARDLRGAHGENVRDAELGLVARHNGILLYASADETLALLPFEDALAAAIEVRDVFARKTRGLGHGSPTISGAITFAHRQVPLRWVIQSNRALLNAVAKEGSGRDALAIEILDRSGQLSEWAAPWDRIGDEPDGGPKNLRRLVDDAVGRRRYLGSNPLLHDLDRQLAPFAVGDGDVGLARRIEAAQAYDRDASRTDGHGIGPGLHAQMTEALVRRVLASRAQDEVAAAGVDGELVQRFMQLCRIYGARDNGHVSWVAPVSWAGLKILRFLAQNWRARRNESVAAIAEERRS